MIITAKEARERAQSLKQGSLNFARAFISDLIKRKVDNNQSCVVLDYLGLSIEEDDFKFFEDLGYRVQRPTEEQYASISWD